MTGAREPKKCSSDLKELKYLSSRYSNITRLKDLKRWMEVWNKLSLSQENTKDYSVQVLQWWNSFPQSKRSHLRTKIFLFALP